jgi:hypothetical protein
LNAGVLSRVEAGDTATAFVVSMRGQRDRVNGGAEELGRLAKYVRSGLSPAAAAHEAGRMAREH